MLRNSEKDAYFDRNTQSPSVLILDEPMNGLDKNGVEEIRQLLLSMKNDHKTIVIASHNAEDMQVLCDEVYEMENGKLEVNSIKQQI